MTLAYIGNNNAYYDFKCLFVYYNNADECIWFLDCISTLVLLFTVPLIYDKYEDKVDSYGEKAMADLKKQYAVLDAKMLSKIPRGPLKKV